MSIHKIPGINSPEDSVLYNVSRRRPFPFGTFSVIYFTAIGN